MKCAMTAALGLIMVVFLGCQTNSPRGGEVTEEGMGFKVGVPRHNTQITQGNAQMVTVTMLRESGFKQDVDLEFTTGDGVELTPGKVTVKASEGPDVQLRVAADSDAALGDYNILALATPKTGKATSFRFKVTVVAP